MMTEPSGREMLAWLRRAETIKRKAETLMADVCNVTGFDHPLTDYVDNVVHMSEELAAVMAKGPDLPPPPHNENV